MADHTRLKQVLLNLLSNAVKYNRDNGGITVNCVRSGSKYLRISVRDTGRGIAAAGLSRLFKLFERLESAYEGIEGTGIGLALAKKLMLAMHGDIGVESVPGQGSTFWFELPVALAPESSAESEAVSAADVSVSGAGRHRLLCIEDNPANLRLLRSALASRENIQFLDATNAETGLELASSRRPDLILLDINLPGMDGFEALRRLQADPLTSDIPVVAVSANAMVSDIERGYAAGFVEYLTKPIDIARLLAMIDRILGEHD